MVLCGSGLGAIRGVGLGVVRGFAVGVVRGVVLLCGTMKANIADSYAKQGNLLISTTGKTGTFRYCSLDMSEDAWTCVSTEKYGDYSESLKTIS